MYPLLELGPLRLSTGGLLLLLALFWWGQRFPLAAVRLNGSAWAERAERSILPIVIGAIVGGRLWYGLFSWDLYGPHPGLFLTPRVGDLAWPGALAGALFALWFMSRRLGLPVAALADAAALALPPAQALAAFGMLLSGEALGLPTSLPWSINLFGASRHPTQIYYTIAALVGWVIIRRIAARSPFVGALSIAALALQGLSMLLIEAFRADSLVIASGLRVAQIAGLALVVAALVVARRQYVRMAP
jgi:phosphatidylglycerol:prolipoprotein diacylglycerol transferase